MDMYFGSNTSCDINSRNGNSFDTVSLNILTNSGGLFSDNIDFILVLMQLMNLGNLYFLKQL